MKTILLAAAAAAIATCAHAAPIIDGTVDSSYGAAKSSVGYDPAAPDSNFSAPTDVSKYASYDIYLQSDANFVYGVVQVTGGAASPGVFANLYFDIDPANKNGSDIGFELGDADHANFFVAGQSDKFAESDIVTKASTDGSSLEFAIPDYYFTTALPGVDYFPGQQFATGPVVLRLSQSFGYSVAGGASYGYGRLGVADIGGVPEPATWSMMILGFLGAGVALRGRRQAPA